MPEWQQIQHILVISDRTISLVNFNRPIVFLFAASRSFESLLRMSEYFGNTSALMCCVLGALHLVFGILLHVRVVAGVFCFRSVVQRKLACFQWKLCSHVVRSLTRLAAYSLTDIDCSFQCAGFIAPNHLVFIEPGFFMLSEYQDEDLTIPVSVVFLRSFGMRGPKCWCIDLQRVSVTLLQA